jgi:hypothetical protein
MTFGKKCAIDFEKTFNGGMLKKQDLLCAKSCRLCHDLGKLSLGTKFKTPILSLSCRSSEDVVEGTKVMEEHTATAEQENPEAETQTAEQTRAQEGLDAATEERHEADETAS